MTLVNVGTGMWIAKDQIQAVLLYKSEPIKRLVQQARKEGRCIDLTKGKRLVSVVLMLNNTIYLTSQVPNTIKRKVNKDIDASEEE